MIRRADLAERIDIVEDRMDSTEKPLAPLVNSPETPALGRRSENDIARSPKNTDLSRGIFALREDSRARNADMVDEIMESKAKTRRLMLVLHEEVMNQLKLLRERRRSSS